MSSGRAKLLSAIIEGIGRTNELSTQMNHTAAGLIGVNATDLQCIQLLQHGPLTAGELARLTGLTTASMTGMIDRLEKAGYVARVRDTTDRRRVVVELQTDQARATVAPMFLPLIRRWRDTLADYDVRDLELIADFLARVNNEFDTELARLRDPKSS
jgi:DNA-binding MarR family transcriptional regulator